MKARIWRRRVLFAPLWMIGVSVCVQFGSDACAAESTVAPLPVTGKVVNVRDYGAKGDGVSDDTAALQAAFKAAWQTYDPHLGSNEVLFPPGVYSISDTLQITGAAIRGQGYATIWQKTADKDIFYHPFAWRLLIEGFTFKGGKNQVSLGNPNIDTGFLQVRDCRFYDAGGFAIEFRRGSNSTQTFVEKCIFYNCYQVLFHDTDEGVLRDSWITSYISTPQKTAEKAVIETWHGRLLIENVCGVPIVSAGDQRWIDFHGGQLICRNVRFGGEGGGFTAVVAWAKRSPSVTAHSITLDSCTVSALGNNKRAAAISLEEIPNSVVLRNSTLTGMPALQLRKTIDLQTYFKGVQPGMLHFALENNIAEFGGALPAGLANPVRPVFSDAERGVLSAAETAKRLQDAIKLEKQRPSQRQQAVRHQADGKTMGSLTGDAAPVQPHTQQINPTLFQEIAFNPKTWRVDERMDGTSEPNSDYIAIAPVGDDVVLMRRKPGQWPHLTIKDIEIDLDRFPMLSLMQRKAARLTPAKDAIKIIDQESGVMLTLDDGGEYSYRAYDLAKLFGKSGKRRFTVRYYYLGFNFSNGIEKPPVLAQPGDYIVLDFLRAEARN